MFDVLDKERAVQIRCRKVRWVVCAGNFDQLEVLGPQALLDPEVGYGEMPYPTQSAPLAYSYCRGGITVDAQSYLHAQIFAYCLQPKAFGCSETDA